MTISAVLTFLGGIGIFLLSIKLMSEGLIAAAGDTLRSILSTATRSRSRAIVSGITITTLLHSSGAVIFATVGFVNAGLLNLKQAVGIIYGSNLGKTATTWVVALLGFNLDLQTFAMPLIGVGMIVAMASGGGRWDGLGRAFAGFGLFFLGLDVLQGAFAGIDDVAYLEQWAAQGVLGLVLFAVIGGVLTMLMQSSGASLAITLTAAVGGLIPLDAAAAMVIGSNIGSTTTVLFALIGATANAKRAASAHVIFNVVASCVSFVLLQPLLWLSAQMGALFSVESSLATVLAIFHTLTNVVGMLIMLPLTSTLVKQLKKRFISREEDTARPQFLDRNVQQNPSMAFEALAQELHRMNGIARHLATEAVSSEDRHNPHFEKGHRILESLSYAISEFASGISRDGLNAEQLSALPDAQRVAQYLVNLAEHAQEMVVAHPIVALHDGVLDNARNQLRAHAVDLLECARVDHVPWRLEVLNDARAAFEAEYQALKAALLRAGTAGQLDARRMAHALERLSDLHRVIDQASKAAIYLDRYIRQTKIDFHPTTADIAAAETVSTHVNVQAQESNGEMHENF